MFSVVSDFANNLSVLGSSVSFVCSRERYFASSSLTDAEADSNLVEAALEEAKDSLENLVDQITAYSSQFSKGGQSDAILVDNDLTLETKSSKPA